MNDAAQTVLAYHRRLWGDGDLTAIDDLWAPDAVVSVPGFADSGVGAIREDVERYFGAFDDIASRVVEVLADGDRVALEWETEGRHIGPYGSVAATGRTVVMRGVDFLRVQDGRITACRSFWDGLSVYEQLGVLTAPE